MKPIEYHDMKLTILEREALIDAAKRPGGWALFKAKTTAKLAARGWFVQDCHPAYGMQWRITEAGRAALNGTN
jgi:hypothetical protein